MAKDPGSPGGRQYDVVLMDIEMPGELGSPWFIRSSADIAPAMDGVTAVKQIRLAEAEASLDRQLVIALTGNAQQRQIDQALAAGMDDGECLPEASVSPSL